MHYLENIDLRIIIIFIIILVLSFFINKISKLLNLYDIPISERKIHKNPISIINGFLILVTLNIYFFSDYFIFKEFNLRFNIIILILINIFYILGYFDDIKDLSPKTKTFLILFILLIIIPFDQNLVLKTLIFKNLIGKEIYLNQSSIFITIFFIYIFYNFLNFIDGLNGVAISVALFFIVVLSIERGIFLNLEILIILTLILCLILNLKNKSFLGNSGISTLSLLISIFYIREYNLNQTLLCDEIFLIFLIPGIDMTRLVFSRIMTGKSISDADLNHLHHYFLNIIDRKFVFIFYLVTVSIPYFISKLLENYILSIFISLIIYLCIFIFLRRMPKKI